jgi:hypothetical protein
MIINKKLLTKATLIFLFLISIFSINSNSNQDDANAIIHSKNLLNYNLIQYIIIYRFFLPFFLFFFLFLWYFIIKKKNFTLISLFLLYNFWQIIILIIFKEQVNIGDFQLTICAINFLLIIYITLVKDLHSLHEIFLYILIIFISSITIFFIYKIANEFIINNYFYFFYFAKSIIPETRDFYQASIRSTGLGRMLLLIFFFLFFIKDEFKDLKKLLIYLALFIVSICLYGTQARGALIGIPILIIYYLFFLNDKILKKITTITFLVILPIIIFEVSIKKSHKKNIEENFNKEKTEIADNYKNRLTAKTASDSGRLEIWKNSFDIIKEKKLFFGVGPQGDRKLIGEYLEKNKLIKNFKVLENNSSNAIIYSYLSGGVVNFFILIFIYFLVVKIVYKNLFIDKFINKNNYLHNFSLVTVIYLLIRSLYENSFTIYGIDFVFFLITNLLIIKSKKNLKKFRENN